VGGAAPAPQPKSVTVGQVKKCPSCGSPVESFQARCESCGAELKNTEVSETVQKFIDQINKFDEEIALEKGKTNLKKTVVRVAWVILNVFTYGIPLLVRAIKRVVFPSAPKLLPLEERKKDYIENFVVPNNREDIVEFVLFASAKVNSMMDHTGRSVNDIGAAGMWGKIWSDKCSQLSARASVVLANDEKTMEIVRNLGVNPKKLLQRAKKRDLVKIGVIFAALVAGGVIYIDSTGVLLKVPGPRTFEVQNVTFAGFFGNYFRTVGEEVSVIPDPGGKDITIILQIECIKTVAPDIEEKISEFKKAKGWEEDNCTVSLDDYPRMTVGDFETDIFSRSQKSYLSAMLDMKAGDVMTVNFILEPRHFLGRGFGSGKHRKKAIQKLMAMPVFSLSPADIEYEVINETLKAKGSGYSEYTDSLSL
jgi:hypothetical protein